MSVLSGPAWLLTTGRYVQYFLAIQLDQGKNKGKTCARYRFINPSRTQRYFAKNAWITYRGNLKPDAKHPLVGLESSS